MWPCLSLSYPLLHLLVLLEALDLLLVEVPLAVGEEVVELLLVRQPHVHLQQLLRRLDDDSSRE